MLAAVEAEEDTAIEVTPRHIYLPGGATIRTKSPRLRAACKQTGILPKELQSIPKELQPTALGSNVPRSVQALLQREAIALWEERLQKVLTVREQGIQVRLSNKFDSAQFDSAQFDPAVCLRAQDAKAAARKGSGGGAGGGFFAEEDAGDEEKKKKKGGSEPKGVLVELAEEHMNKVLSQRQKDYDAEVKRVQAEYAELSVKERAQRQMLEKSDDRLWLALERRLSKGHAVGASAEASRLRVEELARQRARQTAGKELAMAKADRAARERAEAAAEAAAETRYRRGAAARQQQVRQGREGLCLKPP